MTKTRHEALTEQLRTTVNAKTQAVSLLLDLNLLTDIPTRIDRKAPAWASALLGADEPEYTDWLARLLFEVACPTEPPPSWWQTPLGQVVASRVGHPIHRHVPYATAGAMLGCSKQYVQRLVEIGSLQQGPDGAGVTTASVRNRINARS